MKVKSRISRIALIRLYDYATTIMMANGDSNDFLEELVRLLKSPLLPVQSTIAREIGEDQPFVSNASRGILKRSEEHTSELQSLMRISNAVFCMKKKRTLQAKVLLMAHLSRVSSILTIKWII